MKEYIFDMNHANTAILSNPDNCKDCVKNFTDIVLDDYKNGINQNINDPVILEYLKFIKTNIINSNLILDEEVKIKLYNQ
ncbi:unknown similar to AMEV203 [Adoxophyes honmai entomopoxvirus 'L']|uniref:Uncharacterized protein n=1 Tax=Adoxophyes honmai entomopoxvirus 'L' TaxID=1293540 RepID=A0A916KP36_9POXV|nr:unknown similar to AMEV203 [Adoxophyes honmai entomopoxvirus 'L']CCU55466.1 unknown similar to AMEV203 [Adoxophyes honmai entomopoxvirus 'L']